ncbi:Zn-dependent hydrolase [Pseudovibrio exalbescens]|uniref:Zn-dependent hydrolase n=1 Tax=Pseudovibrio exalbescens TaxID=197461 RepID=UPI000C9C0954|nr:Zn-dependent hydrolase [Pseudovibrio exalbescens]
MKHATVSVDGTRLKSLLDGVNQFGFSPETGGYNRLAFSESDMACRNWFMEKMQAEGLDVRMDPVGNVFGRFGPADGPCVIVGSHLDTVADGGAFDGSLGACAALEAALALRDANYAPSCAIEVVATSEEEGRFGGMLGSQSMTGQASLDWVNSARDSDGVLLKEAMRVAGLDWARVPEARRSPQDVKAFLELHIEQGPVLERAGCAIGIAEEVSGVCYLEVQLSGVANHSGTTPMDLRCDAFAGLTDISASIPELIAKLGTEQSRITIGKVDLVPNHPHTIAGRATFSIIIRDTSRDVMCALRDAMQRRAEDAAERHGLTFTLTPKSWLDPQKLAPELAEATEHAVKELGLTYQRMPSGAGHDAQTMQTLCPSGLIFIPSQRGISHSPEEYSVWSDIENGANALLHTLIKLTS